MSFTQYDKLASKMAYVYRFDSTIPHLQCYFVRSLGYGVQSYAQLVMDRETGLKVVQKVDKRLHPSNLQEEEPAEISILRRLTTSHGLAGYQPRWITLLNYEKVPLYQETKPSCGNLSHQVSYWKFCNGGTLHGLLRPYIMQQEPLLYGELCRQNGQPSLSVLPKLPISLVARAIRHICETLEVMYQGGSEPVYHCDLHTNNIFLHWTKEDPLPQFYIGDFGMAKTATQSLLNRRPLNHQLEGTALPGVAPDECRRRRWDLITHHLTSNFMLMVGIAAKDATSGTTDSLRPQPQAPRRSSNTAGRDLVKQIARDKNEPAWRHRHNEANTNSPRSRQDNNYRAAHLAHHLNILFQNLETLNEQDQLTAVLHPHLRPPSLAHIIELARQLENESLQHELNTTIIKDFVGRKKGKALFQEFGTKPFVFRPDGPEAKEILKKALRRPPPGDGYGLPIRYLGGRVGGLVEPERLEEVWGRGNVAGPWRVVEVNVPCDKKRE
ncbi:hypothetical protein B0T20DRAFT_486349, partial [Sordaria brevicollis]